MEGEYWDRLVCWVAYDSSGHGFPFLIRQGHDHIIQGRLWNLPRTSWSITRIGILVITSSSSSSTPFPQPTSSFLFNQLYYHRIRHLPTSTPPNYSPTPRIPYKPLISRRISEGV